MLTAVTVRSTADLQNEARYRQTAERLEMIRAAILGDPRQTANGQTVVSGFAADMGRLPTNLRDLLEPAYCATDRSITHSATCGSGWVTLPGWQQDSASGLWYGWRGPYLHTSQAPSDSDAFSDGWGREAQNATDHNYGWQLAAVDPGTGVADSAWLVLQSLGADMQAGGADNYNRDYPPNSIPSAAPAWPAPVVEPDDWLTSLDGGVAVEFSAPKAHAPPPGGCSKNEPANNVYYTNQDACTAVSGTWHKCSDRTSTTRTACETAGHVWFGEGYGCLDTSKTNTTSCGSTWRSCSDLPSPTDKVACEGVSGIWYGEGFRCSDTAYATKAACETAGKTWYDDWTGCSNDAKKYHRLHTGSVCSGSWIYNSGVWTENDLAGNPARVRLCLRIHSRAGTLTSSSTVYLRENGERQTLSFQSFKDASNNSVTRVPAGDNAIGVYEYDPGTDQCTTNLYPEGRRAIPFTFRPRAALPVIPW